jgi:hypothetical protein
MALDRSKMKTEEILALELEQLFRKERKSFGA